MGKNIGKLILKDLKDKNLSDDEVEYLFQLGQRYESGKTVEQDYGAAFEIFKKCTELGNVQALSKLGWYYQNGITVEKDCNKAFDYFTRGVEAGDPVAMVGLGNMYADNDIGAEKTNWKAAVKWYLKAALRGNTRGKYCYARCLYHGYGMKRDYEMAFWLFREAARGGEDEALFYLGLCYNNGFGVKKNIQTAIGFYEQGASHGDSYCYSNLARLYADGFNGQKPDYKKATGYYLDALSRGDALGYAGVGHLYEIGAITGEEDIETAKKWYQLAAQNDYKPAIRELERLGDKYNSKARIEEGILRTKCVAAIDDGLSIDDLESAVKIIRKCGYCSYPLLAVKLHWGHDHTYAVISRLKRIGVVSTQSFNSECGMYHPEKAMDGFEKVISSVKSTNLASRQVS